MDGDSLPQWRAYADDGKGVALGFAVTALDRDHPDFKILNGSPTTFAVRYCTPQLKRSQSELIELTRAYFADRERRVRLAFYVILNSLQFKHPAYEHEKEFRALILGDRSAITANPLHDFKPRKGQWIEFLKRPVFPSIKQSGTLMHIRIGPAAPSELVRQVRDAVTAIGLPMGNIDQSTIPYTSYL